MHTFAGYASATVAPVTGRWRGAATPLNEKLNPNLTAASLTFRAT